MPNNVDANSWPAALGRLPSGLFIITASHNGQQTGMLASWVQQCGFEPPAISLAMKKGRPLLDWLQSGSKFAVNIIEDGNKSFVAHFGKGFEPGEPAFEGLAVSIDEAGTPILDQALAHLICEPTGQIDAGDHLLFVAKVTGGSVHREGRPSVHVRKSGLNY